MMGGCGDATLYIDFGPDDGKEDDAGGVELKRGAVSQGPVWRVFIAD